MLSNPDHWGRETSYFEGQSPRLWFNPKNFQILDEFIDKIGDDGKHLSYSRLIAVISFSGFYARKLAELDYSKESDYGQDYRSDINHLSTYASKRLEKKLVESWGDGYSWVGLGERALFKPIYF